MRPLLIIRTGNTFPELAAHLGDFDAWVADGTGLTETELVTVAVDRGERLPCGRDVGGVIVTGSPAMVTEQAKWMRGTAEWLKGAVASGRPVLGICFGHQLLAAALGGAVGWNPRGREIGTVRITLTPGGEADPLLGTLPRTFAAHVTHRQSVLRLPDGARLLATSDLEPHQAFAVGARSWGVQFHPEFTTAAMHGYLDHLAPELVTEGCDLAGIRGSVRETPEATALLGRFAALCRHV